MFDFCNVKYGTSNIGWILQCIPHSWRALSILGATSLKIQYPVDGNYMITAFPNNKIHYV